MFHGVVSSAPVDYAVAAAVASHEPSSPAGGGSFGGGGSTDGWDDAGAFSADDYAAFDRTVAADRNDPRGSYDS